MSTEQSIINRSPQMGMILASIYLIPAVIAVGIGISGGGYTYGFIGLAAFPWSLLLYLLSMIASTDKTYASWLTLGEIAIPAFGILSNTLILYLIGKASENIRRDAESEAQIGGNNIPSPVRKALMIIIFYVGIVLFYFIFVAFRTGSWKGLTLNLGYCLVIIFIGGLLLIYKRWSWLAAVIIFTFFLLRSLIWSAACLITMIAGNTINPIAAKIFYPRELAVTLLSSLILGLLVRQLLLSKHRSIFMRKV